MAQIILTVIVVVGVGVMLYRQHKLDHQEKAAKGAARPRRRERDPNDTRDWPAIVDKARELAELQKKPSIGLSLDDRPNEDGPHSCVGGRPSLPPGTDWPTDADGKPMLFLAQINFAEMPQLDGYPEKGLLAFFVMDDDLNGCHFPSIGNDGFQVLFFEDTDGLERAPFPQVTWEYSPLSDAIVQEGRPLRGEATMWPLSPNSHQVADMTKGWYPNCPDELWDGFHEELAKGHASAVYYGGHPNFVQQDFRRAGADPDYSAYTEVLLQMGYVQRGRGKMDICWGDAGEACFMITKEDLAARRFDRVAYNWDCG